MSQESCMLGVRGGRGEGLRQHLECHLDIYNQSKSCPREWFPGNYSRE